MGVSTIISGIGGRVHTFCTLSPENRPQPIRTEALPGRPVLLAKTLDRALGIRPHCCGNSVDRRGACTQPPFEGITCMATTIGRLTIWSIITLIAIVVVALMLAQGKLLIFR